MLLLNACQQPVFLDYEVWIVEGEWNDAGIWKDASTWDDGGSVGPTALAVADPKNGVYSVGATTYSAAQVFADPSKVTANGLELREGDTANHLIGAMRTAFLASEGTGVFVLVPSAASGLFLTCNDATDSNEAWSLTVADFSNGTGLLSYDSGSGSNTLAGADSLGTYKVAFTWGANILAWSINGGAPAQSTNALALSGITQVLFCGYNPADVISAGQGGDVHSMTLYAPQDNTTLQSLSA